MYYILGLLLLAGLSRSVLFYLIPDGQYNDDASFLLRGLNFAGVNGAAALGNPIHFAPGWPLLLAPFLKFSGQWYVVGRVLSTFLTCLTACLLAIGFARRSGSRLFGAATALLFLNAPQVMILGSSLMAEPLYIFLTALCLLMGKEIQSHRISFALGLAAGWCFLTKTEGLVVVAAVALATLAQPTKRKFLGSYLAGFAAIGVVLRQSLPQVKENAHLQVAGGVFKADEFSSAWAYLEAMVKQNSGLALEALLNTQKFWNHLLWLLPLIAVFIFFQKVDWKTGARALSQEPVVIWLLLFPLVFFFWPFFNARYWPLWSVLLFAVSLSIFSGRARWILIAGLLLLQAPGSWHWYQMGPLAARFEHEIYLPFYRGLNSGQRVLTLNSSRVATIARVPAVEPLMATDFQSLPIGMAHLGCDLIEWEVHRRTITSVTGSDARRYPPDAIEGLRKSTLFKLERSCAFAESYRLVADPEKLKQAGFFYSRALQTVDAKEQRDLLLKCLALVPDLPEAELALYHNELRSDPDDAAARAKLDALLKKYPFLQSATTQGKP